MSTLPPCNRNVANAASTVLSLLTILLFISTPAFGVTYAVTATHLTMHVGDLVPPCVYKVTVAGVQKGAGSAIFSAPPTCANGATSMSPVGSYTLTMNPGTLANPGTDTATYENGTISVIAPDGIGAKLVDSITYPPGFFSAAKYPVMDVTNNPVCTMVGDGVTDNQDCQQYLFAFTRGSQGSNVTCNGTTTVAWESGTVFTGMSTGPMRINGVIYTIASVASSTSLTLTANCPTESNVSAQLPRTIVSISGTAVTWVSGPQFASLTANEQMLFGSFISKISSVTDATDLVLTTAPPTSTATPMYTGTLINTGSAGLFPFYLYYPAGTYLLHDTLYPYGAYWSLWGVGPQQSILKLAANSAKFNGSATTQWFSPLSVNGNDSFHIFIRNMGFESGVGNPKVEIVASQPSNYAAIRNVQIWSDDSNCISALAINRNAVGPAMMRNVAVYGCADGILGGNPTYNYTGEDITVEGQTAVGILNNQLKVQFRHVLSDQDGIPAMTNNNASSSAVLMDSELFGNGGALALQNSQNGGQTSTFLVKNTTVTGYSTSMNDYGSGALVSTSGNITGIWTGTPQSIFDTSSTPNFLNLTVQETPQANDPAVSTWCALGSDITTWQATINSCAATTVYAPPGQYAGNTNINITIPDTVDHLQFYDAMPTTGSTYTITFTEAGTSSTPLIFEDCPNAQCAIAHTGSRALVVLDTKTYNYATSPGAGNLFVDDSILGANLQPGRIVVFQPNQSIWARQLNQEESTATQLQCSACTLWVLGYKTEHNGLTLSIADGAKAEIYGFSALGDPAVQGVQSMMKLVDSSLFATGSQIVQTSGNGFTNWVTETRSGTTASLAIPNGITSNANLNIFYSFGAENPPSIPNILKQGR